VSLVENSTIDIIVDSVVSYYPEILLSEPSSYSKMDNEDDKYNLRG